MDKRKDRYQVDIIEGRFIEKRFVSAGEKLKKIIAFVGRRFFSWADSGLEKLYLRYLSRKNPVIPKKVVFVTFQFSYTCNPKYICERLLVDRKDLDIVWVVNADTIKNPEAQGIPENVRLVKRGTKEHYCEILSANVWVDNALNCCWRAWPKKEGQYYVNTWHGSLGIKRLDTYDPNKGYWISRAHASNGMIDYMLSNSDFDDAVFSGAYWPDVSKLRSGHPRNDLFYNPDEMLRLRKKVLFTYRLPQDAKIILYATTFRDDNSIDFLNLDLLKLKESVEERFGGDWYILFRPHPRYKKQVAKCVGRNANFVLNAVDYPDIQELMAAADIGISDYSSWIFDFMLSGKPCFIYAPDLEKYNNLRGFYYPIETTPFPIAMDNKTMKENVLTFDEESYAARLKDFLEEKGCSEDGHASERVSKLIQSLVDGDVLKETLKL